MRELHFPKRSLGILVLFLGAFAFACGAESAKADAGDGGDLDDLPDGCADPCSDEDTTDLDTGGGLDSESETSTAQPDDGFCRATLGCDTDELCVFATGRCEKRAVQFGTPTEIWSVAPTAAAAGDVLVIDGQRFYTGIAGLSSTRVQIDGAAIPVGQLRADENRVLVLLGAAKSGVLEVSGNGGTATWEALLTSAATGVLPCDADSPPASGFSGGALGELGPHAVGYVDLPGGNPTRVTYPASCGGLRRPPVSGTWPLVALLHGDGAVYLNYEHLAGVLASFGFVTLMPESDDPDELAAQLASARDADLSALSPVLEGLATAPEIALVGHSRGTARLQGIVDASAALRDATVASVFLGPVDDGTVVPGLFLVLAATGDRQSMPSHYNATYARQPAPKWKVVIQGGNHSLFSDHKVWQGALFDLAPTISRATQHQIVVSFVLPLLERAFGLIEHDAGQLDAPPASDLYTVTYEL